MSKKTKQTIIFCLALLFLACFLGTVTKGYATANKKVEYKVITLSAEMLIGGALQVEFNNHGKEGWELVQVLQTIAIFKR